MFTSVYGYELRVVINDHTSRDTGIPGYPGYRDTGIPGYPGYRDTGIPGYRDTTGIRDTKGYRDIYGYRGYVAYQQVGTISISLLKIPVRFFLFIYRLSLSTHRSTTGT